MSKTDLADRIKGCWIGKGIGGTLGMPFEGCQGPLDISMNNISVRMLPNDDLDLQLLWIHVLETHGTSTRARHLASAAAENYRCYPDEYGIARWNTARGWEPPLTGLHNNAFGDGMGAAIRSEIWACIAAERPALAAALAREDALVDHFGDGVYGEMFLAALESALFSGVSLDEAADRALRLIPGDSRLATALRRVRGEAADALSTMEILHRREQEFPSENFTDVVLNLCRILAALLNGKGNVNQTLLEAVACGGDTDCTGATCGSILGILHGADGFAGKLRALAGTDLSMHPSLRGLGLPQTLDDLTRRCLALHGQWSTLPDAPPPDTTPSDAPRPEDPHPWLVLRIPVEDSFSDHSDRLSRIARNPADFPDLLHCAAGIHFDLHDRIRHPGDILYLFTWIRVDISCRAQLMACATAGITVWMDGQQILNYHGRRTPVPAFHRTEGGGTVPVSLEAGRQHALCIRLHSDSRPLRGCLAIGDGEDRYLHPVHVEIPGLQKGGTP